MAGAEGPRRRGRARLAVPLAAAVLVLAAAGGVTYAFVGGSSSGSSSAGSASGALSPDRLAVQGLQGRRLQYPECAPLHAGRWKYPFGPPVAGLPPLQAEIGSNLYEVFAINYSCKDAAAWVQRLSKLTVPVKKNGNATVLKGPAGFYCAAWPDAHGRAYAGGCQTSGSGECAPSSSASAGRPYAGGPGCKTTNKKREAFGWNWNVANRRVVFAHDAKGKLQLFHVSGSDTNVIFRYLNGSYQLQILNTSGIGYLNGFTWAPSPGWKVTALKAVKGATCSRTPAGKISCSGTVDPPSCLCTGDGGVVSITFSAAPSKQKHGYLFGGSPAQFKITKMTPVPYIIPGTPDEAAKRSGV